MSLCFNGWGYLPQSPSLNLMQSAGIYPLSGSAVTGTMPNTTKNAVRGTKAPGFGGSWVYAAVFLGQKIQSGCVGFLAITDTAGVGWTIEFRDSTTGAVQFSFQINATGNLLAYSATGALVASSQMGKIISNGLSHYEIKFNVDSTGAGSCTFVRDGEKILTIPSMITQSSANQFVDAICIYATDKTSYTYFTDLYSLLSTDPAPLNTFIGRVKTTLLPLAGPGSSTQWTPNPSTDANWQAASNTKGDDTSYVSTDTVGATDLYTVSPNLGPWTVLGVQARMIAEQTDATQRTLSAVLSSNGTQAVDTAQTLSQSYQVITGDVHLADPATGYSWSYEAVNGLQVGPKVAS